MQERRLPLGIQDFEELRKGNYLYVDKTDMVWASFRQITFCVYFEMLFRR